MTGNDAKVIMFDSPEAAQPHTMQGWLSRDGYFYQEESTARHAGCTHRPCEDCGAPTSKHHIRCDPCQAQRDLVSYERRTAAPWDGVAMVYSEARNEYYCSPDDAEDSLDDGETLESLRLLLCKPQYVRAIEVDDFADELPEDGEAPDELLQAIDVFNASTEGVILSWFPGSYRLDCDE